MSVKSFLKRENEELRNQLTEVEAALRDCMSYVDVDNLTMQTKQRAWLRVLQGKSFEKGNVKISSTAGGDS